MWNLKGALRNFTQNFEPIDRKICILLTYLFVCDLRYFLIVTSEALVRLPPDIWQASRKVSAVEAPVNYQRNATISTPKFVTFRFREICRETFYRLTNIGQLSQKPIHCYVINSVKFEICTINICIVTLSRMAWQWAETLVEIRVILADIRGTTKYGRRLNFPKHEFNRPVCLEAHNFLLAHLSQ